MNMTVIGQTPTHARILYAGPALAGVSLTMEQLARGLGAALAPTDFVCHFDWRDQQGREISVWSSPRTSLYFASLEDALAKCVDSSPSPQYRALGPVFRAHRELLRDLDGIVFVADSQRERETANVAALSWLSEGLRTVQRSPESVPLVLQCNKRDLPNAAPLPDLERALQWPGAKLVESIALTGAGVREAFDTILELA